MGSDVGRRWHLSHRLGSESDGELEAALRKQMGGEGRRGGNRWRGKTRDGGPDEVGRLLDSVAGGPQRVSERESRIARSLVMEVPAA